MNVKSKPRIQPNMVPGPQGVPIFPKSSQLSSPFLFRKSQTCAYSPRRSKEAKLEEAGEVHESRSEPWLAASKVWILISDLKASSAITVGQNQEITNKKEPDWFPEQLCLRVLNTEQRAWGLWTRMVPHVPLPRMPP